MCYCACERMMVLLEPLEHTGRTQLRCAIWFKSSLILWRSARHNHLSTIHNPSTVPQGPGVASKTTPRALSSLCQLTNGSGLLALDGLALVSLATNILRSSLIALGDLPRRWRPNRKRKGPIQEVDPAHRPPLIVKQYFSGRRLR